jgi:hypothetical protein
MTWLFVEHSLLIKAGLQAPCIVLEAHYWRMPCIYDGVDFVSYSCCGTALLPVQYCQRVHLYVLHLCCNCLDMMVSGRCDFQDVTVITQSMVL